MGYDLWNFYQYLLRMRKLEYDHMSHFTGKGRSERRSVSISPEEHLRYLALENQCEALKYQILVMKSKEEEKSSDGENLHEKVMSLRLTRGAATTIKSFKHTVHDRLDNIEWSPGREGQEAKAHNQYGEVFGYTLDQEDLDVLAGDKKQGVRWMWEAGNYLLTMDGKIYLLV